MYEQAGRAGSSISLSSASTVALHHSCSTVKLDKIGRQLSNSSHNPTLSIDAHAVTLVSCCNRVHSASVLHLYAEGASSIRTFVCTVQLTVQTWQEFLQSDGGSLQQSFLLQVIYSTGKQLGGEVLAAVCIAVRAAQHIGRARPAMRLHAVSAFKPHTLLQPARSLLTLRLCL